ncbi:MAG: hypothetical protein LBG81_04420 [Coriobacteriaceae bacterium]|jgi:hypothetical protein|nr:hypothetical protein [Coriobacteriaceae bacterium]
MFCANCGKNIPDRAKFCPFCANAVAAAPSLGGVPAAAPSAAAPSAAVPTPAPSAAVPGAAAPDATRPASQTSAATASGVHAPAKASGTKRPLLVVLAAAVVVLALAAAVVFVVIPAVFTGVGTIAATVGILPPAQNDTNQIGGSFLRSGNATYICNNDYDRKVAQILRVDDSKDAKPEELYSESYSGNDSLSFRMVAVHNNKLYFTFNDYRSDRNKTRHYLMALDLGNPDAKPQKVTLSWKKDFEIPESISWRLGDDVEKDDVFSYAGLFGIEGSKLYLRFYGLESDYTEEPILMVDLGDESITYFENTLLGYHEGWSPRFIKDGSVYYLRYDKDYEISGLFKAGLGSDITREDELLGEGIFKPMGMGGEEGEEYANPVALSGNTLYYNKIFIEKGWNYKYTLCSIDLGSKDEKDVIATKENGRYRSNYNITDGYVYYFDEGDLRRCKADGSGGDELLARSYGSSSYKYALFVSGDWLYYEQGGDYYRMKKDEGDFPSKSLS